MVSQSVSSWGNLVRSSYVVYALRSRYDEVPALPVGSTILPYGNGRSYGDSCLNPGGALLLTRSLDRFIAFDRDSGLITCEAGVLLADILQLTVPAGWFLAVVPGTSAVTVGGAIANDVHGKNHHRAGTFGCHVRQFELLRSDGQRLTCSPATNADWFGATIRGLGLTGLITYAQLQLRRTPGTGMDLEVIRFANLDEFFRLSEASDQNFEYTVAWVDCLSRGRSLGRGLLRSVCVTVMRECRSVAQALQIDIPESMIERRLNVAGSAGGHKMSMLQDLERGRTLELDALVAAVQELGKLTAIPTPALDILLPLAQERGRQAGLYP